MISWKKSRRKKYSANAKVEVHALHYQRKGRQPLVYSCPNPSVSLWAIVRFSFGGKGGVTRTR